MRLVGLLDSPYVRRVAVSLRLMELPFVHVPLSVFRDRDAFAAINPVVRAPTLVTAEGTVLMDSTVILDHAEPLAPPALRLMPEAPAARLRALRLLGLALAACEKTVQVVYETTLRPVERQHGPWLDRVRGQLAAAYAALEAEAGHGRTAWLVAERPLQADVTAAVAWRFTQFVLPGTLSADRHPALAALSARAEALPAFAAAPLD